MCAVGVHSCGAARMGCGRGAAGAGCGRGAAGASCRRGLAGASCRPGLAGASCGAADTDRGHGRLAIDRRAPRGRRPIKKTARAFSTSANDQVSRGDALCVLPRFLYSLVFSTHITIVVIVIQHGRAVRLTQVHVRSSDIQWHGAITDP
jgi:hypothetical protein